MGYNYLGKPCRNFCILASTAIIDPKDGREKIVLSNFVSGGTGNLIFIDARSIEGESIELPGDEGAWALLCLGNGKLLVGTCGLKGYLHCLDLKSRTWDEPLRDEHESYIWNLALGSDGMVYGGTWPGCVLLRYNPEKHTLENLGRMSRHKENLYSRQVYGSVQGRIFVNCGLWKPHIAVWDMETCMSEHFGREGAVIREVNKDFVCTITGDELDFYNPLTLEPLIGPLSTGSLSNSSLSGGSLTNCPSSNSPISVGSLESLPLSDRTSISMFLDKLARPDKDSRLPGDAGNVLALSNGDIAGVRGQEFFVLKKKDTKLKLMQIPIDAPPTRIMTITFAPDGKLWGSSNFGQTIFNYNSDDGTYWNSMAVCSKVGEVYGMRVINGKIFMAAYAGGDHIVYDPSRPWDEMNNVNPVTLKPVGPALVRPHGKSTVGPDGAFWTGWTAKYGVYGGGLSRVDADTYEVSSWYDPVPGQEIESLAAGDKYLYFTTGGMGNGLVTKKEPFYLGVWDPAYGLIHKIQFPDGITPGHVEIVGNMGIVSVDDEIRIFDCNTMEFCGSIKLPAACTCIVKYNEDEALVFCDKKVFVVRPVTGEASLSARLPGAVRTAAVSKEGEIFFADTERLYKLVK